MLLKIGIVGLPNVGKSTLFQALTKISVPIASYPFTTIEPSLGVVAVPDERLERLQKVLKPEKTVAAMIEFVDIAGLVKGAAEGQGLGNQFLSHIYGVDAILFLLRAFSDPEVPAAAENPEEELAILREELRKKDEEILKRSASSKLGASPLSPRLAEKPAIAVCNVQSGGAFADAQGECKLALDCQLELEMAEMKPEELKELGLASKLPLLIQHAYETLNLMTFYTIKGGKELHAWPIKRGTTAPEAGGVVHSDFREKFIRAEVINWQKLLDADSWHRARELGRLRTEGREYIVQDGDIIEFRI